MYEAFYGFNARPFQLSPDPAFYFASRGHQKAFSYLEYGVVQGEGFIVITGEIGAGKTTLVRSLIQRLDPAKVVAAQLVSTQLSADDMLRAVATTFGINVRHDDKARLIAEIEGFLMALVVARKRPLLLVDEAQNLSLAALEELRMLSNFQMGALQSFLIGQPELRDVMRTPETEQFRQRIIASYHLGPLSASETQAYIEHRLRRVGWIGNPEFEPAAFELIYETTGGIPRRINKLCERLLLAAFLAEKHSILEADVSAVAAEMNEEFAGAAAVEDAAPVQPQPAPRSGESSEKAGPSKSERSDPAPAIVSMPSAAPPIRNEAVDVTAPLKAVATAPASLPAAALDTLVADLAELDASLEELRQCIGRLEHVLRPEPQPRSASPRLPVETAQTGGA